MNTGPQNSNSPIFINGIYGMSRGEGLLRHLLALLGGGPLLFLLFPPKEKCL